MSEQDPIQQSLLEQLDKEGRVNSPASPYTKPEKPIFIPPTLKGRDPKAPRVSTSKPPTIKRVTPPKRKSTSSKQRNASRINIKTAQLYREARHNIK